MEKLQNEVITPPHPHVVIFPLPIQGPVNCMLKLSELILSLTRPVSITFINSEFIQNRLDHHSPAPARLARFGPRFKFETVPDGLGSLDNLRGGAQLVDMTNYLGSQAQTPGSRLRELLGYSPTHQSGHEPVSCVIADGFFWFMADVAKEVGVPLVYFETISPCGLWTYLCLPKMLHAGDLPFSANDMDTLVTSIPGMETYLRCRDLPSFYRNYDPNNEVIRLVLKEAQHYSRAQGHILNTFDDLEGELLSHMCPWNPNLYNVGPIHLNLVTRLEEGRSQSTDLPMSLSNSIWEEDRSCLSWLDAQPLKSVLFVSIGSLAFMTKDQLVEFWHGLVSSGTRFLWVRRANSVIDLADDDVDQLGVSDEVLEGTRERGRIVSWAPQEEVLKHEAVGGFLTHGGWNSTLESIVEGVPMICWPFFVDQQVNSRVVSEVWRIGLDMKDTCNRAIIETMIKDLMGDRKDEFSRNMDSLAKSAAQAVSRGGSSYNQLNRLVDDIQFKRFPPPSNTT